MRVADAAALPRLMLRCGTEDRLVAQNRRFVAACSTAGGGLSAAFEPGEHTWEYWERQLPGMLAWLIER